MADLVKKQIVRWVDADGRRCKPNTAGATKRVEESRKWYGTVGGKPVPLSADKTVAQRMLRKLLGDQELAGVGLADPFAEQRKRPLSEHLADFKASLEAKGNTRRHVQEVVSRVQAALDVTAAVFIGDLDVSRISAWLTSRRADKPPVELPPDQQSWTLKEVAAILGVRRQAIGHAVKRHRLAAAGNGPARRLPRGTVEALIERASRGASPETTNHYVASLKAFGRWLVKPGRRTGVNPLDGLQPLNTAIDRRHDRRELSAAELRRLLNATRKSKRSFRGLDGEARFHLYACGAGTGFRARTLGGLRPEDFDLNTGRPVVTLPARLAKNKRIKVQPLPADVADLLRAYLADRPSGLPVWPGTWASSKKAAEMIRNDLEAANIPYSVPGPDGPLFADFHALRHSYLTLGGRAGIDLRTLQELAGHSTPVLTARYTHVRIHDLASAVEKLPAFLPTDESDAAKATGTDGVDFGCSTVARPPAISLPFESSPGTKEGGEGRKGTSPQPLVLSSLGTSKHFSSSRGEPVTVSHRPDKKTGEDLLPEGG